MRGPRAERPLALLGLGTGLLIVCVVAVGVAWFMLDPGRSLARRPPAPRANPPSPRPGRVEGPPPAIAPDAFLGTLARAAGSWWEARGPEREVVDQVYLAPDVPTFFEAIGEWDDRHYFPILIDDPAWTLPFLRAFRPARVVRLAPRSKLDGREALWQAAVRAVGRAWSQPGHPDSDARDGSRVPEGLGRTPPGLVLSEPAGSSLAGGVALAAGRFQPLIRFDPRGAEAMSPDVEGRQPAGRRSVASTVLSLAEARSFARRLEDRVAAITPDYRLLGDACDFLTLAGDWPFRYLNDMEQGPARGEAALDDLVGRNLEPELANLGRSKDRWAFAGRLLGDAPASVYRAMCSLFLPPDSALLWNTYASNEPWNHYGMNQAAERLARLVTGPLRHRAGADANLLNWHKFAPGPVDRTRLVFFNSSGEPKRFAIDGGKGRPADLPPGGPSAVVIIHSFSAADPTDPRTIAGRWLALGAFAYFGSMNEPFLGAFRPPNLTADLLAGGLPLSAAVREGPAEPFGQPWRLIYLGDPLYRLDLRAYLQKNGQADMGEEDRPVRLDPRRGKAATGDIPDRSTPVVARTQPPASGFPEGQRSGGTPELLWCLDAAIADASRRGRIEATGSEAALGPDWLPTLRAIARDRLRHSERAIWDALVIDAILKPDAGRDPAPWYALLWKIPADQWSPRVEAMLEYRTTDRLASAARSGDLDKALAIWDEAIRRPWPDGSEFPAQITERVGSAVGSANRLKEWYEHLQRAQVAVSALPAAGTVSIERRRVESKLAE